MARINPVYKSEYASEILYRSDKNFMVRLKSMIERTAKYVEISIPKAFINIIDDEAESYLFEGRSTWQPVLGETIYVRNNEKSEWVKRIFFAMREECFTCVHPDSEDDFRMKRPFTIVSWDFAKPIPKITEITMEEIAAKFNIPVEEIKIKQ